MLLLKKFCIISHTQEKAKAKTKKPPLGLCHVVLYPHVLSVHCPLCFRVPVNPELGPGLRTKVQLQKQPGPPALSFDASQ